MLQNYQPQKQSLKTLLLILLDNLSIHNKIQLSQQQLFTNFQQKYKQGSFVQKQLFDMQNYQDMKNCMKIFYGVLSNVNNQWVGLLVNDGICSESLVIVVNNSAILTKLYQSIITKTNQQITNTIKPYPNRTNITTNFNQAQPQNFQHSFLDNTNKTLLTQILNHNAKQLVDSYIYGKQQIKYYISKIDKQIKTNQIINTYLVFCMLKQMSVQTQKQIILNIKNTVDGISQECCLEFCKYIQKNYQYVILEYVGNGYIYGREEYLAVKNQENRRWLEYIKQYEKNNIQVEHIQSLKGDSGMLITRKSSKSQNTDVKQEQDKTQKTNTKTKQQTPKKSKNKSPKKQQKSLKEDEKLILKIQNGNQIKVLNAKICQQSWKIFQSKDSINQLYQALKNQIQQSENSKAKQYVSYGIPTCQYATIGGSLGKCLADIDKYSDANQFFVDLSKTAAICSTFSLAMAEVPILSYFIVAGGFSYSFYLTCSNKATSSFRKANQIGSATFTAVGSVGSTLAGILLGQAVIPVPFLGAFIGGVVGGFLGTKGVTKMNQILSQSNFRDIIAYMRSKLIAERYWKCTKYMLQRIGLDQKYFHKHTPAGELNKDIYMTAICFCIVTFYQSKRSKQFNQQKLKQHQQKIQAQQKMNKSQQKNDINQQGSSSCQKQIEISLQKHEQNIYEQKYLESQITNQNQNQQQNQYQKQNQIKTQKQSQKKKVLQQIINEQIFQNQFNIVKIIQFLTQQNFMVLDHLDQLQNFICHLV